jgi:acyl-CoA synthetase (AMP-forming)/AMP-acid ligase II
MVSGGAKGSAPLVHAVKRGASEPHQASAPSNGNGLVKTFVSCGQSLSDQKILIVNPDTLSECRPEEVGEIWVSGPSVARGYWNRPEETGRTFNTYLPSTGAGPFLRTGDLGFLKDDQLYIVGRLKDVIIIGGQNYHPQDIEVTAERSHHALKLGGGAAFGVEVSGEERLVVVHEVERHYEGADRKESVSAIRRAVAEEHQVHVHDVVLIRRGTLPKTSSGKPQRHLCRMSYLNSTLEVWADGGDSAVGGRRRDGRARRRPC